MGSQGYFKLNFYKGYFNTKDPHQVDVGPQEEELEGSWGVSPPMKFTHIHFWQELFAININSMQ